MWWGYPIEGYYDTCWLTGLWSNQAEVEGIVPKATWHWVVTAMSKTIPLGNQAAPHCMKAFRPRGALWTVTLCFPTISWENSLTGDSESYKLINHWLWRHSISFYMGPVAGIWRGAPVAGTLREG